MGDKINSVYAKEQWHELEAEVFDGAGEAISRYRKYARSVQVSPVPFLIACALYALSSTPGRVTFDAGLGKGAPNLFVVLMGAPGLGKDRLMRNVREAMTVAHGDVPLSPVASSFGSGEGLLTSLKPSEDEEPQSVLVGSGEVSVFKELTGRKGSTLRSHLLDAWSGNTLGVSNRSEKLTLEQNTYRLGMWLGAQPDTVSALLTGDDDGLRHRFVFTEVLDPLRTPGHKYESGPLMAVSIPDALMRGEPMRFHESITRETLRAADERLTTGFTEGSSHGQQTALKLAMGFALLRSADMVDLEDYKRAKAIMRYSNAVILGCEQHFEDRRIAADVARLDHSDRVEEAAVAQKQASAVVGTLRYLERHGGGRADYSPVKQSLSGRCRQYFDQALEELKNLEAVTILGESKGQLAQIGEGRRFYEVYVDYQRKYPGRLEPLS